MYTVEMLPAAQGDCLWIEYGDPGDVRRILIDGGTVGTIDHIRDRIESVAGDEGRCHLDLVVVTHVDGDHIEGIIKLLGEPSLPVDIADIWFNGYPHLPDADGSDAEEFLGAKQGDFLSALIRARKLPWNSPWKGGTVYVPPPERGPLPTHTLPGGMEIVLLSPTYKELVTLAKRWESELEKAGVLGWDEEATLEALLANRTLAPEDDFLSDEDEPVAVAVDVDKLLTAERRSDASPANGSSIAFIASFDGTSCLFSGDAYSSVLEDGVDRLREETGLDRVSLDAYKTPHHASRGNVHDELLHKLRCHRFLVSTSGARFKHPDAEAIAQLIGGSWRNDPADDDPVELIFNYDSPFNEIWSDPDLETRWNYSTIRPAQSNEPAGIKVQLAP